MIFDRETWVVYIGFDELTRIYYAFTLADDSMQFKN
jgi:hypothetical protein